MGDLLSFFQRDPNWNLANRLPSNIRGLPANGRVVSASISGAKGPGSHHLRLLRRLGVGAFSGQGGGFCDGRASSSNFLNQPHRTAQSGRALVEFLFFLEVGWSKKGGSLRNPKEPERGSQYLPLAGDCTILTLAQCIPVPTVTGSQLLSF